jgi:hypothetical protein
MRHRGRRGSGELVPGSFGLFVLSLIWGLTAHGMDVNQPSTTDAVLAIVRDCTSRSSTPWPEAWQREYGDTIREAIALHQNAPEFNRRMQILRDGFALYWPQLQNTKERSQFEVRHAEIRWYVENLMIAQLPGEQEKALLRRQYEDLANHAAESLLAQFSFLDPNRVQKAKADHLADYCRNLDAPLLPIFLISLSETQVEQIKQRWHDLRYVRVDLWRSLGGYGVAEMQGPASSGMQAKPPTEHPDYLLTWRSLDQLRGQLWSLAPTPPDYYREAAANTVAAGRQRVQATLDARNQEQRLGVAVWQTEYLGFLLAALLETAQEDVSKPAKDEDLAEPGR